MTPPPKLVRFQGRVYRLVSAVMPEKVAEQKVKQLTRAVDRPPSGKLVNLDEWDVDEKGLLAATNTEDGGVPMLVMWNPVTSEIAMSSNRDMDILNHTALFKKIRAKLRDYPFSHFTDWVRASVNQDMKKVLTWSWQPLLEHVMYLMSPHEQRQMGDIHSKGNAVFEQLLPTLGSGGYSFHTTRT